MPERKNHPLLTPPAGGSCRIQSGFSLVEIMVALVIGLLGIIVMMQVFAVFEGQKRTTTGGDDAISSGSIALYNLQRDIQHAGWGFGAVNTIGCVLVDKTTLVKGTHDIQLTPVTINHTLIPAGDSHTDTLLIVSGAGNGAIEGDQILSDLRTLSGAIALPTVYAVRSPSSFANGDFVVAAQNERGSTCSLNAVKVTGVDMSALNVTVSSGSAFTIQPGDRLFHLGANPVIRAYAIRDGNLTVCDWRVNDCADAAEVGNAKIWTPIANNMVSLRAQYGRDTATPMDGQVDLWDQSTPDSASCAALRVPAVRVVLVARSSQPEKTDAAGGHVTQPASVSWTTRLLWMGNDSTAHTAGATAAEAVPIIPPDPSVTWPTWQDFRYKIFQTVIPLRNVTSQGVPEGC